MAVSLEKVHENSKEICENINELIEPQLKNELE